MRVRFGYQLLSKTATCPGEVAYKPSSLSIFSIKPDVVLLSSNVNCLKAVCFLLYVPLSGKTKGRRNKKKRQKKRLDGGRIARESMNSGRQIERPQSVTNSKDKNNSNRIKASIE